jgi:hypothetical protein
LSAAHDEATRGLVKRQPPTSKAVDNTAHAIARELPALTSVVRYASVAAPNRTSERERGDDDGERESESERA